MDAGLHLGTGLVWARIGPVGAVCSTSDVAGVTLRPVWGSREDTDSFFDGAGHRVLSGPAAIVVSMTAAGQPHPIPAIPSLPEGAGPRAIRAALLVEEREEFDQAYRRALAEAGDTLELAGVLDVLEHW